MIRGGLKSELLTGEEREVDPYLVWEGIGLGMFPFWRISVVRNMVRKENISCGFLSLPDCTLDIPRNLEFDHQRDQTRYCDTWLNSKR